MTAWLIATVIMLGCAGMFLLAARNMRRAQRNYDSAAESYTRAMESYRKRTTTAAVLSDQKQVEALRWLIEHGLTEGIYTSALGAMYEERARAEAAADPLYSYGWQPTAMRVVAWKRAGGAQLARMKDAGLLEWDGWSRYYPNYKITEAGMEAARGGQAQAEAQA